MIIRKQPIISWLLNDTYPFKPTEITVCKTSNAGHARYLFNGITWITDIRKNNPDWGLPELLRPSFEKMMEKSAKSFYEIDHQLFQEFYEDNVCGILLHRVLGTVVYGFGKNTLYVWLFKDFNGISCIYDYFYFESTDNNTRLLYSSPTLFNDPVLYDTTIEKRAGADLYSFVGDLLMTYLAVKKYGKVETITVPDKAKTVIEDTVDEHPYKEKIKNESGQEVIIMDSRWFVTRINNNEIPVKGFYRMQNKKNERGEWYQERIFIAPFVRHGYHRNAKIKESHQEEEE